MSEKELADRIAYCWRVLELAALAHEDDPTRMEVQDCIGFLRGQFDPIELDSQDLKQIKDFGIAAFHTAKHVPNESKQAQVYLILKGLAEFLFIKRKMPTFKVD
jgi:hypothetical protein